MQQVDLFSLESFELHFGLVLNGKHIIKSTRALGLCRFASEEFDHNDLTLIALYYGKIRSRYILK